MFKCPECGGKDFGNNAGAYGLIRICKNCDFRFHAARDAEYLDTGEEEITVSVEDLPVEAEAQEEPDTPLEEVKPKRATRKKKGGYGKAAGTE